jgi:formate hydrogenlyase subunit 4
VTDPSPHLMAFAALIIVAIAETGRVPVDNPATHLELTMIHEALILEYSGRHLALIEWATAVKLTVYCALGIALFMPWGMAQAGQWQWVPLAVAAMAVKLALAGAGLALLETVSAKMRIFRAPEFLGMAFMLAVLGMLTYLLLGA